MDYDFSIYKAIEDLEDINILSTQLLSTIKKYVSEPFEDIYIVGSFCFNVGKSKDIDVVYCIPEKYKTIEFPSKSGIGYDIVALGIVPPRPPCPDGDLCLPSGFQYLISEKTSQIAAFMVLDDEQNSLNNITNVNPNGLPGSEEEYNYQTFELSQYSGPINVQVMKTDAQNNTINFSIQAFKQ